MLSIYSELTNLEKWNFHISFLHSNFDEYISPNVGNDPQEVLNLFAKILNYMEESKKVDYLLNIIEMSLRFRSEFNPNKINLIKVLNGEIELVRINGGYYKSYTNYGIQTAINILIMINKLTLHRFVEKALYGKQELLLSSGYNNETGGHLIGFYFRIIDVNLVELFICNSGDGIQHHERYLDKKNKNLVKGIARKKINIEELKKALILRTVFYDLVDSNSEILYKYFYKKIFDYDIWIISDHGKNEILENLKDFKENNLDLLKIYLNLMNKDLNLIDGGVNFNEIIYNFFKLIKKRKIDDFQELDDYKNNSFVPRSARIDIEFLNNEYIVNFTTDFYNSYFNELFDRKIFNLIEGVLIGDRCCVYYKFLNERNYELILFPNEKLGDVMRVNFAKIKINEKTLKSFFCHFYVFENMFIVDEKEYLEEFLIKFFHYDYVLKSDDIDSKNEYNIFREQMSGSCTDHGFYHMLMYLCNDNLVISEINDRILIESVNHFVNFYFFERKNNKGEKFFYEKDKNILDIMRMKKMFDVKGVEDPEATKYINNLYNQYYECIKACTYFEKFDSFVEDITFNEKIEKKLIFIILM